MAQSLNKVMLIGRLGKDPEIRAISSGAKVANFSIATDESYKDKDGVKHEKTEWHNIVIWRGLAEVVEKYVKKGDLIYIEGKLTTEKYEKDGVTKYDARRQARLGPAGRRWLRLQRGGRRLQGARRRFAILTN